MQGLLVALRSTDRTAKPRQVGLMTPLEGDCDDFWNVVEHWTDSAVVDAVESRCQSERSKRAIQNSDQGKADDDGIAFLNAAG